MTCEQALELLSGQLDHINTPEEAAQLQAHLDQCEACRELLRVLKENDEAVRGLSVEPPAELRAGVMTRIRAEQSVRRKKKRVWLGIGAAAALVCAVGIGSLALPVEAPETPMEPAVMMARSMPAAETVHDTPAYDAEEGFFHKDPSLKRPVQELAEELGADIAVTYELYAEMELCSCEALADGSLLYHLTTRDGAVQLSRCYGVELVCPAGGATSDISYALLTYRE